MILSRAKPKTDGMTLGPGLGSAKKTLPKIEDFLLKRDYIGGLTLIEFLESSGTRTVWMDLWRGFCHFHLAEYDKALQVYEALQGAEQDPSLASDLLINIAICQFYLGMYTEAQEVAEKAPESPLRRRLLFHLAHKLGDEEALMLQHGRLQAVPADQLCLASLHYLRGHYQDAIDVYKKMLQENREYLALNVYIALCYYKLDYYDVSQEVLAVYLNHHPDSTGAVNLKACNVFRLYNGKAAETELKTITSDHYSFGQDLVKHNLVVFRNGEGALKVLPQLVDVVPEARLNLAGYRLRTREPREAQTLIDGLTATSPLHYILKGVVAASLAADYNDEEQARAAQKHFQLVGGSASECDTIPGRQCMAAAYFLRRHYDEVLVYLSSIKTFFANDDTFNFNYAQAKMATGQYGEAEELLEAVQDETLRASYTFVACLCRCHVMNRRAHLAWDACVKMAGSPDCYSVLQLVANDAYRMGHFLVAARAFHMLDKMESGPEVCEGIRGACAGVAQAAVAALEQGGGGGAAACAGDLREAVAILRATPHARPDPLLKPILRWAHDNRIPI